MKRILSIIFFFTLVLTTVHGQYLLEPNKPHTYFDSAPGYITINEIEYGFSKGEVRLPYKGTLSGFSTIHAYQADKNFIAGGGTGVLFYQDGTVIPVFVYIRYNILVRHFTPYFFSEAGLAFDSEAGGTLFINPGAGVMYALSRRVGVNLGTSLFLLSGTSAPSYINLRFGITYKPAGRKGRARSRK